MPKTEQKSLTLPEPVLRELVECFEERMEPGPCDRLRAELALEDYKFALAEAERG